MYRVWEDIDEAEDGSRLMFLIMKVQKLVNTIASLTLWDHASEFGRKGKAWMG